MPVELLQYPPLYCLVGAYRLAHDPKINKPVWRQVSKAAAKGLAASVAWTVVSLPFTRFYVKWFLKTGLFRYQERSNWLGISVFTYTTWLLLLQQASMVLEYFIAKELRIARSHAYEATVESRGKDISFWGPYVEEWKEPPIARARRSMQRKGFLEKAGNRWVRRMIMKVVMQPLNFVPFWGMAVSAGLASVTMGRVLHRPFFVAKKMTPEQEELFVVERLIGYRTFGFFAALLERFPLVGLIFSISNRIGAAMWAHDLEKVQHLYSSGSLKPTKRYESKTAAIEPSGLPEDFAGGFPTKKGPVHVEYEQSEKRQLEREVRDAAGGEVAEADVDPREVGSHHEGEHARRRVPPKWEGSSLAH